MNTTCRRKSFVPVQDTSNFLTYLTTFSLTVPTPGPSVSRAGPESQDLNAYPHVRCEAIAKGFGIPT
jgi:hypothetical protein